MPLFLVAGAMLLDKFKLPDFLLVPAMLIGAIFFLLSFFYIMDLIVFFSKNVSIKIHS
jgi:hypothetical protein